MICVLQKQLSICTHKVVISLINLSRQSKGVDQIVPRSCRVMLQYNTQYTIHGTIYRPDSIVLMLRYCANLKATKYESMSLDRIVADKSHCVIVA